jgi:DNA-binding Lrp family transcriptional regulator
MKEPLKDVELRLISELMKNSKRSDRELGRAMGISQPTVTRLRRKLEKMGVIREYTIVPDFTQIGYQIMGVTFLGLKEGQRKEGEIGLRKAASELEQENPFASILAVNGMGINKDRLFITLYRDFADYSRTMQLTKQLPWVNVDSMETFLVNLQDENHYRILTMAQLARHIQLSKKGVKP